MRINRIANYEIPLCERAISLIVVHCTATKVGTKHNLTAARLDEIHRSMGFSGCGYHYYITQSGEVHEMRALNHAGAHVKGHNKASIGVAYEGGIDDSGKAADTRTEIQKAALRALLTKLADHFRDAKIVGHRDLSPDLNHDGRITPDEWIKLCPCFDASKEYADISGPKLT